MLVILKQSIPSCSSCTPDLIQTLFSIHSLLVSFLLFIATVVLFRNLKKLSFCMPGPNCSNQIRKKYIMNKIMIYFYTFLRVAKRVTSTTLLIRKYAILICFISWMYLAFLLFLGYHSYVSTNRNTIYMMADRRGAGLNGQKMLYSLNNALGTVEIFDHFVVLR